jgi:nucleotide-binding universal stress UspA family protein
MSHNGDSERRVVVAGIDFSPIGELALDHVLELAAEDPSVEPHFVHVAQAYGPMLRLELEGPDGTRAISMEQASELLRAHVEEHVQKLKSRRPVRFGRAVTHIAVGNAAQEIAQLALDLDADLVVVGTHGRRGLRRMLLGSVAEAVIRMAHCPVYVVRPKIGAQPAVEPFVPPLEPSHPRV